MSIQLADPMESEIERNGETYQHYPRNSLGEALLDETHLGEQDRWLFAGVGSYTELDLTDVVEDDDETATDEKSDKTSVNGDSDGVTQIPVPPSESETDGGCCSWFTSAFGSEREMEGKKKKHDEHHEKLGEWPATAICANDITSSCFYVAGICSQRAGIWAPISLLLVSLVLFLFRGIYGEVVTALPLNGGAYNALLNTTTKNMAAIAACLTMLSYTATAVVSAQSAADYLNQITDKVPTSAAVVGLLGLFAFLNLIGISESSKFALLIFLVHMVSLSILVVACLVHVAEDRFTLFADNWHKNFPTSSWDGATIPYQIFFGFCTAFLGISGFETSANFVEEQKPGVFVKTLRNMWMIVTFFNPVLCLLAFGIFEYNPEIKGFNQQQTSAILAKMGERAAGTWLNYLIGIDASLVLSGAVLTSYVGIGGLIRRMALDRCLPMILVQQNKWRNTAHFVIIGFFLVCTSLYFILNGNTDDLAGVYTVAFMSVMSLFAIGNIMLKYKRGRLPRQVKSTWVQVIVALLAVLVGLVGNIVITPTILQYFAIYFGVTLIVVWTMFLRISLLKVLYFFVKDSKFSILQGLKRFVEQQMKEINQTRMVFFTKEINNLGVLNKAILYVRENEQTNSLIFVHFFSPSSTSPSSSPSSSLADLRKNLEVLDRCYPKLKIDLICVRGRFTPRTVKRLSEVLSVPPNFMFIACPGNHFPIQISELNGVRLITH